MIKRDTYKEITTGNNTGATQTEIYEIPFENPALPRSRRQDKEIDALANQTMDSAGQISVRGKTGNPRWRK